MCPARALDNRFRRRIAPAQRELDLLGIREGDHVADLGTGVGFLLPEILNRVGPSGSVYAVDIDEENLEMARQRVHGDPRIQFLKTSAASVPGIPSESMDRVLLSLVLCCLVDKQGAMREAWRILKPGGVVLATHPFALPRPLGRLGVSGSIWKELEHELPWEPIKVPSSGILRRHMVRKPGPAPAGPSASPGIPASTTRPDPSKPRV